MDLGRKLPDSANCEVLGLCLVRIIRASKAVQMETPSHNVVPEKYYR
jgi:hypothetical protein